MKKRKMLILAIASALIIGGTIVAVQNNDLFGGIDQQNYQSAEEKQLAYLKKHENNLADFVKSLSPKVESVQIDWDQTRWEDIVNGTPQGGGEVVIIGGGFNNIEGSTWQVMFEIKDGQIIFDTMMQGSPLRVGGEFLTNGNLKTFDNFSQEDILLYKKVPSWTETRKLDF